MRVARFVYLADGSPLHLRSVLKGSALFEALLYAHGRGAVIAASGGLGLVAVELIVMAWPGYVRAPTGTTEFSLVVERTTSLTLGALPLRRWWTAA